MKDGEDGKKGGDIALPLFMWYFIASSFLIVIVQFQPSFSKENTVKRKTASAVSILFVCCFFVMGCLDASKRSVTVNNNNGGGGGDTVRPTIVRVTPTSGATSVPVSTSVSVTFSEPVAQSTVSATSCELLLGATQVSASISFDTTGKVVTLTPASPLAYASTYSVVISTSVTDLAGNALAAQFSSSFVTAGANAPTPLSVSSVNPTANATSVPVTTKVTFVFSASLDPTTVTTSSVTLTKNNVVVPATVSTSNATVTLTPSASLDYSSVYTTKVLTSVKNTSGTALSTQFSSSFTTASYVDTTPPTVVSVNPAANATSVPVTTSVSVTFSEPVAQSTVSATSCELLLGATQVSASISFDTTGKVVTLTPASPLAYASTYSVVISTSVTDLAGNALAAQFSSSFVTAAAPPPAFTPFGLDVQYHVVGVVADAVGNVYAYGYYNSPVSDIFIASFDANGNMRWLQAIATPDVDWPQGGITVSNGFVYIQRIRDPVGSGSTEIYVDKLAADTGLTKWSELVDSGAMGSSIAVDDSGNVYATTTKGTTKLDFNGVTLGHSTVSGSASTFAFGGLFVAGTQYVDTTNLNDRYLMRLDAALSSSWTEWRHDVNDQDVRGVSAISTTPFVYVAEDSFVSSSSGVQFTPYVSGYSWNATSGTVSLAWTKTLPGGRINASAIGMSGSCYIVSRGPNALIKMGVDGTIIWNVTTASEGLCVAEYNGALVYVADGTNVLEVFDAVTGVKH